MQSVFETFVCGRITTQMPLCRLLIALCIIFNCHTLVVQANDNGAPPKRLEIDAAIPSDRTASKTVEESIETVPSLPNSLAYRPISRHIDVSDVSRPLTENVFAGAQERVPAADTIESPPGPRSVGDAFAGDCELTDADAHGLFWSAPMEWTFLPNGLLWEPPMANQREPRMFGKFTNLNDESTIETAIGAEFGLFRWLPIDRRHEGFQIDGMAAVFTRFNQRRLLVTSDFRVGLPVTYAKGPWSFKVSYEHTSTHLGDEFIEVFGRMQEPHVRDEIVVGLARRFWNQVRLYGQAGYSFITSDIVGEDRDRFDCGVEWSKQEDTTWLGRPFAAFDMDLRSDQDYHTNVTVQVGWQWKEMAHRRSGRMALEYYDGKSPYGQFFTDNEQWFGASFLFDW